MRQISPCTGLSGDRGEADAGRGTVWLLSRVQRDAPVPDTPGRKAQTGRPYRPDPDEKVSPVNPGKSNDTTACTDGSSTGIFGPVSGNQLLIVADAHLGITPPAVEEALLEFLHQAPTLGDSLLVNGDLFDFWFSYRRVIPREGFTVAAALARLRKRMPVVMIGGNHDRWGDDFWQKDLAIEFAPLETTVTVGGRRILAVHGDGLTEEHWSARLMHRITRHPATVATWRALHPDLGFWVVDKMSRFLGSTSRDPAVLQRASTRQRAWAARRLQDDPALGGIVMGHTHRPVIEEIFPGRTYVNPGAWMDGYKYAVLTEDGASLHSFG